MADKFRIYAKDYASISAIQINQFYGVDYYTPHLSVADFHATDMKNFCFKDGAVQVRSGYEEIADLLELPMASSNGGATKLNGVYNFEIDNVEYLLLHIGNYLYEANLDGKDYTNAEFRKIDNVTLANHESQYFPTSKKIYILDSEKYRVLYRENDAWKIDNVEDYAGTYVPTTTIGIMSRLTNVASRQALDDVNLMTPMRKNTIKTGSENTIDANGKTYTYELDSTIDETDISKVRLFITQAVLGGGR